MLFFPLLILCSFVFYVISSQVFKNLSVLLLYTERMFKVRQFFLNELQNLLLVTNVWP